MFEEIRDRVLRANLALAEHGLVTLTWGNVSEIDRKEGIIAIKPSGVKYETMRAEDIVILDPYGKKIDGDMNPSSDTPTHVELYKSFPSVGAVVHTHSKWATVFAQCAMPIPPLGTTHADTFFGEIPCTRKLTEGEIFSDYERETGKAIAELFTDETARQIPAALVCSHGPFCWGGNAQKAVENAVILENTAMMAWHTLMMKSKVEFQKALLEKHFSRKHGKSAYYGQTEEVK